MDDAGRVRGRQRPADLDGDLAGALGRQPPLVRQHVGQIDPVEVLHHEVGAAVLGRAEVGDVDDVRVADARGGARLAPEPLDQILLRRVGRVQDLDRDALADLDVLAGVDGPHAAFADLADHAVAVVDHPPGEVDAQRRRPPWGTAAWCCRIPATTAAPACAPTDGSAAGASSGALSASSLSRSARSSFETAS